MAYVIEYNYQPPREFGTIVFTDAKTADEAMEMLHEVNGEDADLEIEQVYEAKEIEVD